MVKPFFMFESQIVYDDLVLNHYSFDMVSVGSSQHSSTSIRF